MQLGNLRTEIRELQVQARKVTGATSEKEVGMKSSLEEKDAIIAELRSALKQ